MRLSWIEACFEDYKTLTAGDTTAAAALVLAHAISSEESDKAAPLFGTGEAVHGSAFRSRPCAGWSRADG